MTTPENGSGSGTDSDSNPVSNQVRFDRRLANRRGWVEPGAQKEYLENLPDVSDKIEPAGEDTPEEE